MEKEHLDFSNKSVWWVSFLGLFANLVLVLVKGVVGVLTNSAALIADAGHSVSDLLSDGVTLWAVYMARKPKDENHPYGHGKFETLGTLGVSVLLIFTGFGVAYQSFQHIESPIIPGKWALAAAGFSILVNEGLYHITIWVGKRSRSQVLVANAWHHRSDAISSVSAMIGIGVALAGYPLFDPIAGLLVAGLILYTGVKLGTDSLRELTDENIEEDLLDDLYALVRTVEGVESFHEIRARRMGPYVLVDLHIEVDSMISVSAAHQVAERVRLSILKELPAVNEVLVHVDAEPDVKDNVSIQLMRPQKEIEADIYRVLEQFPDIRGVSHIQCHYLHQQLMVQLEIVVDPNMKVFEVEGIAYQAKKMLEQIEDIDSADLHLELNDPATPKPTHQSQSA